MVRPLALLLLSLFQLLGYSQKIGYDLSPKQHFTDTRISKSSFSTRYLGGSEPARVKNFLLGLIENLSSPEMSLEPISTLPSQTGQHLLFQQFYRNIPVYRAYVKVNMDNKGNILSLFDNTFSFSGLKISESFPDSATGISGLEIKFDRKYYFFENEFTCKPVRKIELLTPTKEYYELIIDADGNIIYKKDLCSYYKMLSTDSTVTALVFLPDPLTTAGVNYGSPYIDNNDADVFQLNAQRVLVNIKVDYSNDTFRLKSPYAFIKDFAGPTVEPAYSVSIPDFNFTRSQTGFEDVNTFYHINTFQEHIQQLGFNNLVNYPIEVDPHGTLTDNSYFTPSTIPTLTFGTGGVDDAEDADVIIHEYGHAIAFSGAPFTNNGIERTTLDEANSDYFAASYSRHASSFNWENVYSWDGHNEFWPGRKVTSTKHYPEDLVNNLYTDADIWSSTLMQIWEDIGRNNTDKLIMESLYAYASNMSMTDAAHLCMQADSLLNNGLYSSDLCLRFSARGLYNDCYIIPDDGKQMHLYNSAGFSDGSGAIIRFNETVASANFFLYNLLGQLLFWETMENVREYNIAGDWRPKGTYILKVETPAETASFKLINN